MYKKRMQEQLKQLEKLFKESLKDIQSEEELYALKDEYLGKKGKLKGILSGIKDLSNEEKQTI